MPLPLVFAVAFAFCLLPFPCPRFAYPLPPSRFALRRGKPLHEQIHPPVVDLPKPEPLVEPQRGIEALDMNAQQPARRSARREGGACRPCSKLSGPSIWLAELPEGPVR